MGGLEIKRTNEYNYLGIPVTVNGFIKQGMIKGQKLYNGGGGWVVLPNKEQISMRL